jgi:hypothetical protein
VKLLGKVENLVCRILRVFSTVVKFGLTSMSSEGSVDKNERNSIPWASGNKGFVRCNRL